MASYSLKAYISTVPVEEFSQTRNCVSKIDWLGGSEYIFYGKYIAKGGHGVGPLMVLLAGWTFTNKLMFYR
jgi:hypothetical protein